MAPAPGGDSLDVLRKKALTRRQILQAAAAGAASAALVTGPSKVARAQEEPQVIYDGGVFDAGGETLRIGSWPGFWEDMERRLILDQMQEEFNCQISYDGVWPWFPKFVAGGEDNPPLDVTNWNLEELYKTTRAGDFFVPIEEVVANVPNTQDMWPFFYTSGLGITYLYAGYGYAYRNDQVDPPPTEFASFWEDRFADKRGTYIAANELFQTWFIMASLVFGEDEYDIEAGLQAVEDAMPLKLSDFTGNMQTLLERGEVVLAVLPDFETYSMIDRGVPAGWMYWEERRPVLTQTKVVSKGSNEMQKRLAYAYVNRCSSKEFQEAVAKELYLRPTNKNVVIPEDLADKGVVNTEDATSELWIPDWNWYVDHDGRGDPDITERVNEIFAGASVFAGDA
jgi:putative spermidine/putrescine transport system substrate-binding protein